MFNHLSIRSKVLVAPLAVTALMVAVAAVSIGLLRSQGESFREVVGGAFDAASTTSRLALTVAAIHSEIILRIEPLSADQNAEQTKALDDSIRKRFRLAEAMLQSLEANAQFLDANMLRDVADFLAIYQTVATRVVKTGGRNPTLVSSAMAHYSQLDAFLNQLGDATIQAAKEQHLGTRRFVERSVTWLIAGVAMALVAATGLTWLLGRAISAPLTDMASTMARLADGDHSITIRALERRDEVGSMARSLDVFRNVSASLHERETELAQTVSRLADMRDRADNASQAKTAFLASMSHELRTPLNAILGYARLLQGDGGLAPRHFKYLKTICNSGQHLLTLIDDLLDVAKIESGRLELNLSAVDLPAFLQVVANIARVRADQGGLQFLTHIEPGLPHAVMADERRLRQVLLNLLGNAVKFTERGSVLLKVTRTAPGNSEVASLRFEVIDTGVGIEAADLSRIFQPFVQAGEPGRRVGGTGLGLSICRQLVGLMGGEIALASQPGRGSRFSFELAFPVSRQDALRLPARPQPLGYEGRRRRILVVDDVPENRAVVRDMLECLGFEVVEASDGTQAVQQAQGESPDLVVMDVVMPVLGGLEAIAQIRSLPAFEALPIIAVSASTSPSAAQRTLAAGASAFLRKPLDYDLFIDAVGRLAGLTWAYGNTPTHTRSFAAARDLESADAAQIAPALRQQLAHALAELDVAAVAMSIEAIRSQAPEIAERLEPMAEEFQFEAMLRWLAVDASHGGQP